MYNATCNMHGCVWMKVHGGLQYTVHGCVQLKVHGGLQYAVHGGVQQKVHGDLIDMYGCSRKYTVISV